MRPPGNAGARGGAAWPLGRVIGGDLRLLAVLGQGGAGTVYRARSRTRGRDVALKALPARITPAQRERLRREAELTAALDHPGIVRLLGSGEEDGVPYLVYELIEGRSLEEALRQLPRAEGLRIARDVAAALGAAHARGIVHRDVKPQNVLLDARGRARLVDFGIGWARELEHMTRTGALLGTPHYMAPEQVVDARSAGPPADVWSLGVILYQLLTGRRPFEGETLVELIEAVRRAAPLPPRQLDPTIPPALEALCLRALAADPGARPCDGAAFARELDAHLQPAALPRPRARIGAATPVLGLLALGLAGALLLVARRLPPPRPATATDPPPAAAAAPPAAPASTPAQLGALTAAQDALTRGDPAAALACLESAPDADAGTWYLRAIACRAQHDNLGALAALDRSLALQPDQLPALIARGHLHLVLERPVRGLPDLERAVALAPDDGEAWAYLGLARMEAGDPRASLAAFDRALQLLPGRAATWVNRGSARARMGDMQGAVADYDQALALQPEHAGALEWRARCLLALRRPAEALADIDRALALGADSVEMRLDRAAALADLDREPEGLADLDRALSLRPHDRTALLRRGLARGNVGDAAGSLQDLGACVERGETQAEVFSGRGNALLALGREGEALNDFEHALELEPDHMTARNNRGLILLRQEGRAGEALADFQRLAQAYPDLPQAHNNQASALLILGRAAEALAEAERALALLPGYTSALRNRARARVRLGDTAGARDDLQAALEGSPPGDPIRAELQGELSALGESPR